MSTRNGLLLPKINESLANILKVFACVCNDNITLIDFL